jgi:sugar phosphate permease
MWTVWFTYGAFYFCRTNISVASALMQDPVSKGGLGFSEDECGWFLAAGKIAYAAGQLINGQLSERFSPRKMLAIGMFGTAAFNVMFGFEKALFFFIFIWACNGYCQSLGWTPCVRVLANWFPVSRRGSVIGFVGTGYQVTLAVTYVMSGFAAERFGWQGALFVPAGVMFVSAFVMLFFLEERPAALNDDDAPAIQTSSKRTNNDPDNSVLDNFLLTITNPKLWLLGISLGLLNACRYGFLDWGLKHLKDVQETGVGMAALKYAVLPFGAIAGSYVAGWATERFFGSRRAPITCILLVVLSLLTLLYHSVAQVSASATIFLLVLIGFCIYGPQVLLVGTAPADLARKGTSAAAAGFVNCLGYIGAASGNVFTGYSLKGYGWEKTIYLWAAWAFAAAVAAGLLWGATAVEHKES